MPLVDSGLVDDFDRPNEDPIGPPWAQTAPGTREAMRLSSNQISHRTGFGFQGGESYYTLISMDNDCQSWGRKNHAGAGAAGVSWSISLWADAGNSLMGYRARREESSGGDGYVIYRWDGGSSPSGVVSTTVNNAAKDFLLLRRNGGTIELWGANFTGDMLPMEDSSWVLLHYLVDSTYTQNMQPGFGAGDNSNSHLTAWLYVGFGEVSEYPQIYRRPNE